MRTAAEIAKAAASRKPGHEGVAGAGGEPSYAGGEVLGRGMFSEVLAATGGVTGMALAIKVSKPFDAGGATTADVLRGKMVLRELRIARRCDHPNVARLLGASMRLDGGSRPTYELAYERAHCDLQRIVASPQKRGAHFKTPQQRRAVCEQLLAGLSYLHDVARVAHGELKPANVLCFLRSTAYTPSKGGAIGSKPKPGGRRDGARYLLADFGASRAIGSFAPLKAGALWYRPPELVLSTGSGSRSRVSSGVQSGSSGVRVEAAHDLWALGATLTELVTGQPLLPANDAAHWAELHSKLAAAGRVPAAAGFEEAAMLRTLLSDDQAERASVAVAKDVAHRAVGGHRVPEPEVAAPAPIELGLAELELAHSGPELARLLAEEVALGVNPAG